MKILICTQAVDRDDPILGFFHAWIEGFSKRAEKITVVCLRKGNYDLPDVEVIALGEKKKFARALELLSIAYGRKGEYDVVFVHMNPEYLVAAGWLWKLLGKKTALWYVHKSKSLLRLAMPFADIILTVSNETFPIANSKVSAVGHGVDTDFFHPISAVDNSYRVVSVGRVSPRKNTGVMIDQVLAFARGKHDVRFDVYGTSVTAEEKKYETELTTRLPSLDTDEIVTLKGPVSHSAVPSALLGATVFLNMGETGGVDKAVLEAMSMGIPVISTSRAHAPLLARYPQLVADGADDVPRALQYVYALPHTVRTAIGGDLRETVVESHSLPKLIETILWTLSKNK